MIRKFMTTVALGSLFVGGLAASHLAFAQDDDHGPGRGRGGAMMMLADANKDGTVTKAELTAALEARFARLDVNKDGKLTQEDRDLRRQQRLDAHFAAMDSDKNGQISKAEFAAAHQARFDRRDGAGKPGGADGRHHGFGRGMMPGSPDGGKPDGPITREQFMARPLAMFDKADANKDGKLTAPELQAARQAMRERWQDRKAPSPAN